MWTASPDVSVLNGALHLVHPPGVASRGANSVFTTSANQMFDMRVSYSNLSFGCSFSEVGVNIQSNNSTIFGYGRRLHGANQLLWTDYINAPSGFSTSDTSTSGTFRMVRRKDAAGNPVLDIYQTDGATKWTTVSTTWQSIGFGLYGRDDFYNCSVSVDFKNFLVLDVPDLSTQISEHTLFATSTLYDGNFAGESGGNALCRERAAIGNASKNLAGEWKAVNSASLSGLHLNAGIPVKNTHGELLFADADAFLHNSTALLVPVNYDENGTLIAANKKVWTDLWISDGNWGVPAGYLQGTPQAPQMKCDDFVSNEAGKSGITGMTDNTNWIGSGGTISCDNTARVYCINSLF